jgi:two-component system, NarL family, response regulator NreC
VVRVITVVIADDHTIVRQGLRMLIDADPGMRVIAEAGTVWDAERLTRAHHPAVLVLDLSMRGESGLDAIPHLRKSSPGTSIVVLTMHDDHRLARKALRSGALGFVLKDEADEELLTAIRLAAAGESYLNPRLAAKLVTPPAPPDHLSERELDILRLIALGHTNAEIAEQLFLCTRTIETHRAHLQHKLHRWSRAELVHYALAHGLVEV